MRDISEKYWKLYLAVLFVSFLAMPVILISCIWYPDNITVYFASLFVFLCAVIIPLTWIHD